MSRRAGPIVAAVIAVTAALGIVYESRDRLLAPEPAESSAPATAPPVEAAPAAPQPQPAQAPEKTAPQTSSPLPFAAPEMKAGAAAREKAAAAPAIEVTASAFEPERSISSDKDGLAPIAAPAQDPPAQPGARALAYEKPHLKPMGNMSGYLSGKHETSAFMGSGGRPQEAAGIPEPASQALTMMVQQLSQAIAQQAQHAADASPKGQLRAVSRTRGAKGGAVAGGITGTTGNSTSIAQAPGARMTGQPANPAAGMANAAGVQGSGGVARIAPLVSREASNIQYPPDRTLSIYVAPWCPFCQRGVDQYRDYYARLKGKGIDVRIYVMDDTPEHLADFARRIGPGAIIGGDKSQNPTHGYPGLVMSRDGKATAVHFGDFPSTSDGEVWALNH